MIAQFSQVHEALIHKGFELVKSYPLPIYSVDLYVDGTPYAADLSFVDSALVYLPKIRLIQRPPGLPSNCAHLTPLGHLCYIGPNQAHLPRDNLAGGVLGCIEIAENLLSRLASGDALTDTQDEFYASWLGERLLIDLDQEPAGTIFDSTLIRVMTDRGRPNIYLLGRDKEALLARYGQWKPEVASTSLITRVVEAQFPIGATEHDWPPTNLFMLLKWLAGDQKAINGVHSALKDVYRSGAADLILIIKGPNTSCAAFLELRELLEETLPIRSPIQYLKAVTQRHSKSLKMIPLDPAYVDPASWLERNMQDDHRGLAGKSIVLVGCGAIGGYLTDLLAKSGAGFLGGSLTLIDSDVLSVGNIGRHALGFGDLDRKKSQALAEDLRRRYPAINVLPLMEDFLNVKGLSGADLVINATGDQALSHHMSEQWLEGNMPAVLFSWITGTGCGVQAYLLSDPGQACMSCLDYSVPGGVYSVMASEYRHQHKHAPSCGDWLVPYSAAAAVHAAALACDLAVAWARGSPAPMLRSFTLDYAAGKVVPPTSPPRRNDCKICSRYH